MKAKVAFNQVAKFATLEVGKIYTVQLKATRADEFYSVSLQMNYPNELIEIVKVRMVPDIPNLGIGQQYANELKIGWYTADPMPHITAVKGKPFAEIDFKVIAPIDPIDSVQFMIVDEAYTGITDNSYENLSDVVVNVTEYRQKSTVATRKAAVGYVGKSKIGKCSNCTKRATKRCIPGDFVTAAGGWCKIYQSK